LFFCPECSSVISSESIIFSYFSISLAAGFLTAPQKPTRWPLWDIILLWISLKIIYANIFTIICFWRWRLAFG
jgi:hypothetical protein